jgi:hypothetical protein
MAANTDKKAATVAASTKTVAKENKVQETPVAEMTIEQACFEINYNPEPKTWAKKSDKEKWSMIKAKRIERRMRDARKVLANADARGEFASCSQLVQEAIKNLTAVAERTGNPNLGARNVFMENINKLFKKVNDRVSELDMFVATKMGRGEIRAKVRENLINAKPENRVWLQLDDKAGDWVLIGTGAKQPAEWSSKPIETLDQ